MSDQEYLHNACVRDEWKLELGLTWWVDDVAPASRPESPSFQKKPPPQQDVRHPERLETIPADREKAEAFCARFEAQGRGQRWDREKVRRELEACGLGLRD